MQQQKPQSLLTMLPPEVQKQVLLLIKRLGDEKQAKEQLMKKCIVQEQQIQMLNLQIDKLKKENLTLKSKWQNSFSMISKVRQNFTQQNINNPNTNNINNPTINKSNQPSFQNNKTLKFDKLQNQWIKQSQEEHQQQLEKKETINKMFSPSIKVTEEYKIGQQGYFSIQQAQEQSAIQESRSLERVNQVEMTQLVTAKKPPRQQSLQHSSSRSKLSNRSNKKQQIQQLKQQIQVLSEQIKSKQVGNMSLADKMRRCEQIKNRYKKGPNNSSSSSNLNANANNMHSDVNEQKARFVNVTNGKNTNGYVVANSGYYSPKKFMDSQHKQYHQPMYQNINQSRKENIMVNNDNNFQMEKKQQQQTISNNNSMQMNYQQSQQQHYQQQQQPQQNIQTNSSFINNTSAIYPTISTSKTPFKQSSFYDDNLLDLIEQMNP